MKDTKQLTDKRNQLVATLQKITPIYQEFKEKISKHYSKELTTDCETLELLMRWNSFYTGYNDEDGCPVISKIPNHLIVIYVRDCIKLIQDELTEINKQLKE